MKIGPRGKIFLSRDEHKWVKEHYADTPNADICSRIGVSQNWIIVYARKHKLHKSDEYRKCQATRAGEAFRERGDFSAQREARAQMRARWEVEHPGVPYPGTFYRGMKWNERYGEESNRRRQARSAITHNATIARDRRRVRMGLPPLTKVVKEYTLDHSLVQLRYNMHTRHGYVTDRDHPWVVWFTPETTRSKRMEARCAKYGIEVKPIAQIG